MSSTVSRNQKFIENAESPAGWLEQQFDPDGGIGVPWVRELFETLPDHSAMCRTCRADSIRDPDAMHWSAHPAWWPHSYLDGDRWRPEPPDDFSKGPEYPTHAAK